MNAVGEFVAGERNSLELGSLLEPIGVPEELGKKLGSEAKDPEA